MSQVTKKDLFRKKEDYFYILFFAFCRRLIRVALFGYLVNRKNTIIRAGMTGAITAVGSRMLFGESGNISVFNMNVPIAIPIGLSGALASSLGDVAHNYILPLIPQPEKLQRVESIAVNFATSGVVFCLTLKGLVGLPNNNISMAIGFGGASKLGAEALYNRYWNPLTGGVLF